MPKFQNECQFFQVNNWPKPAISVFSLPFVITFCLVSRSQCLLYQHCIKFKIYDLPNQFDMLCSKLFVTTIAADFYRVFFHEKFIFGLAIQGDTNNLVSP